MKFGKYTPRKGEKKMVTQQEVIDRVLKAERRKIRKASIKKFIICTAGILLLMALHALIEIAVK
jgi:hypothetical protein